MDRYNVLLSQLSVGGTELKGRFAASHGTVKKFQQKFDNMRSRLKESVDKNCEFEREKWRLARDKSSVLHRLKAELRESSKARRVYSQRLQQVDDLIATNQTLVDRLKKPVCHDSITVPKSEWDSLQAEVALLKQKETDSLSSFKKEKLEWEVEKSGFLHSLESMGLQKKELMDRNSVLEGKVSLLLKDGVKVFVSKLHRSS